ncbi:translocation/assembly module TamB domain-containing protein [Wenxinia saemankumensis]|uniref:Autotransporter translocation and assembly factor TamB n=1 Tax=Wenxinia saemankumensis TaxID=1447782 RepID=A0A1M6CCW7_9RHOB|nr:translocation/assembly module TamB domain-containing protein [Wenxinia saemankumensis]SHI58604.1 Autotransporter translocation and assembly factor TamB [Wenxinia saemankumensis]
MPLVRFLLLCLIWILPGLALAQDTAQEDRDRGFLQGLIEDNLSSTARDVRIEGFRGALSSEATVDLLTIADSEGVWLRAEGLVLDWDRSALLRRRLEVEELSAQSIEVIRPPIPEATLDLPEAEATPFSLPNLPLSIRVGDFRIDELTLGEAFLGEALTLVIEGEAALADGEGSATLTAERTDGRGRFELSGAYSNETEVLDLTLDVQEEADGLVANAIGLPGRPSVELTLQGTGPISDYTADLTLATDGEERVTGLFGLSTETVGEPGTDAAGNEIAPPSRTEVLVNVEGDLQPLIPATYRPFVGESAQLSVRYLGNPDGSKSIPQLVVQTDALVLLGNIEVGPDNWPTLLDIRGRFGARDGSETTVPGGTDIGTARLDLQYDASVSEDFTLELTAEGIDREGLTIDTLSLTGTGTLAPPEEGALGALDLTFDYAAEGLSFADPALAAAIGSQIAGTIALSRDAGPVEISRLTLTGPGIDLDASGTVQGPDDAWLTDLTAELEAADLSRFAALAGTDLSGGADLVLDLTARPLDGAFEIVLDGQTQDLAIGDDRVDPLLAGTATLDLAATRDEEGTRLEALDLSTDALSLTASADLTSGASSAEFDFTIPDVSLAVPTLEGGASLQGRFSRDEAGTGTLTVTGDVPEGSIDLSADLSDPGGNGQVADFALVAEIGDLAPYSALAERDLGGAIDLTANGVARIDGATFDVTLDLASTDLAIGDDRIDPLLAGDVALSGNVERSGETAFRLDGLSLASDLLTASGAVVYVDGAVSTPGLSLSSSDLSPFSDIAGRRLGGALEAELSGGLQTDLSTFDLVLDASAIDLSVGDDRIDPLLAGDVALSGAVARSGPLAFTLQDLSLTAPLVTAAGGARLSEGAVETDGLTVSVSDLAPFSDLAGRALDGALDVTAEGRAGLDGATLDLALDATSTDLAIGDERIDPLLDGEIALSGAVERTGPLAGSVTDLILRAPVADLTGSLTVADGIATTEGLSASVPDLSAFSALAGRDLSGSAEFDLSGRAATDAATLDLILDARTTDLAIGDARIDPLLAGEIALSGAVERTGPLQGSVSDLVLDAPAARLSGDLTVADGIATTDGLSVDLPDLAPFSDLAGRPLDGALRAEVSGRAALDAATFDLAVDASGDGLAIGVPGTQPLLDGPVRLSGRVERSGPMAFAVTGLDLDSPLVTATGDATLADGRIASPGLSVEVADLAPLSAVAGRPLDGALVADLSGEAALDLATFDVTAQARTQDVGIGLPQVDAILDGAGRLNGRVARTGPLSFTAEDVAISTPVLGLTLDGQIEEGLGSGAFDLRLTDASVLAPGLTGGVTAAGTVERTGSGQLALDVTGSGPGGVALDVTAMLDPVGDDPTLYDVSGVADISVAQLGEIGRIIGRPLGGSLDATLDGQLRTDLSTLDLGFDARATGLDVGVDAVRPLLAGTGTARGRIVKDGPRIAVQDLAVSFPQFSVTADGTTSAGGDTVIDFDARLADLGLFVPDFPGAVTSSGTATLQPGGATLIDASATGPGGVTVDVGGAVNADGTLALTASGSAPLQLANEFIDPARISGPLTFDLSVNGPPALSSVSGTVSAQGARLAIPQIGEAIEGIDATITLSGGAATIDLTAGLGEGGSVAISGPVGLTAPFDGTLTIALNGLVLRDPQLYETIANGTLTVTGPLTGGARIAGLIELGRTEIRVPSGALGALGDLPEVAHVNAPADVRRTLDRAGLTIAGVPVGESGGDGAGGGGGPGYALDVTVSAPNQIFVRGRGLDAELGGSITIGGTTNEIIPQGQFELVRGRLDILSQRFVLDEGIVSIAGDFDPYLRFVAVTEAEDGTEVRIILDGPASDLSVTFDSSPQLPQDEVLARLLFGRDLLSISPLQAVQLAAAVSTLTGGGPSVLDRFRDGLGLDDLDIATDDEGGVAVRAGRYLSENVYTDVQVGESGAEATINLDLTEDITVRGGVSSEGESSLGIFFERDY